MELCKSPPSSTDPELNVALLYQILSNKGHDDQTNEILIKQCHAFGQNFTTLIHPSDSDHWKWKHVASILFNLTLLQKVAMNPLTSSNYDLCDVTTGSPVVIIALLQLTKSKIPIIYYTSFKTIGTLLSALKQHKSLHGRLRNQLMVACQWIDEISNSRHTENTHIICSFYTEVLKYVSFCKSNLPCLEYSNWRSKVIESMQLELNPMQFVQFFNFCRVFNTVKQNVGNFQIELVQLYKVLLKSFDFHIKCWVTRPNYIALMKELLPLGQQNVCEEYSEIAQSLLHRVYEKVKESGNWFVTKHQVKSNFGGHMEHQMNGEFAKSECMDIINATLRATSIICCENLKFIKICAQNQHMLLSNILHKVDTNNMVSELLDLFLEEDESLVEFLLLHLEIHIAYQKCDTGPYLFDPHEAFQLLQTKLSFDHSVLLDWLTSDETQFLLYFIKYLKYTQKTIVNFHDFSNRGGNKLIPELARLRQSVDKLHRKNMFPYNAIPLLRNLDLVLRAQE